MKNIPNNLRNLKSKVDKLDVDKLVPVPVDLSKPDNVVKNDLVKKDKYENKIPNVSNLVKNLTITEKSIKLKRKLLIMIMINLLPLQNLIS